MKRGKKMPEKVYGIFVQGKRFDIKLPPEKKS